MRSARRDKSPQYPESWQAVPNGQCLLDELSEQCDSLSSMMFGYHLVKLGDLSANIHLPQCPIRHQVTLGYQQHRGGVTASTHKLPLLENSVDAFLVALELDFSHDPHQILRDLDRSITANGMVLVCGLNPISLSGLLRYSPFYRKHPFKQARFFTAGRVKDWLQLLHFDIVEERYVHYPSVFNRWRVPYSDKLDPFIARYLPWSGSAYCLLAKKRTIPMTLEKPRWRAKPKFMPVQAGTRVISPASPAVRPHAARE
ncbi:SAM-dependent methyltransferase [Alteromonas sediminis]|uniref:SAM-dependent methyltransferase n=1 Tax=Alteromonas sediminis TaxID=2259342 RepID=A0A3N5YK17_9ALTE|nr:SAM-dependent methyltransferase [Alteromonas sediminis]RPJ65141.1 SAM-dependent methyltransferase [Alteromonas sediminis]